MVKIEPSHSLSSIMTLHIGPKLSQKCVDMKIQCSDLFSEYKIFQTLTGLYFPIRMKQLAFLTFHEINYFQSEKIDISGPEISQIIVFHDFADSQPGSGQELVKQKCHEDFWRLKSRFNTETNFSQHCTIDSNCLQYCCNANNQSLVCKVLFVQLYFSNHTYAFILLFYQI